MFSTAVTEETDTTTTTMLNSTTNATYNVTTNVTYNVSLMPHRVRTPDSQRVPGSSQVALLLTRLGLALDRSPPRPTPTSP